jgi:hypothetical protein
MWAHDYNCTKIHNSWYFLAWHRAFLYFHERILQTFEGADFRLGVWDWEAGTAAPRQYVDWAARYFECPLLLCGGLTPCLKDYLPVSRINLQSWLLPNFAGSSSDGGSAFDGPHTQIHNSTGSLLSDFSVAAAHPLFYAHHANIDRFWEYWRNHQSGQFLDDHGWLDSKFYFYDEESRPVYVCIRDLLDTERLGYFYERIPDRNLMSSDIKTLRSCRSGDFQQFTDLERRLPISRDKLRLPGSVSTMIDDKSAVTPGQYYRVVMKAPNGAETDSIGGFSVVRHSHHEGHQQRVTISLSFDKTALDFITGHHLFKLMWEPARKEEPGMDRNTQREIPPTEPILLFIGSGGGNP